MSATRSGFPDWHRSPGTYIAGRSFLDEVDQLAADMEAKWGCGRLRLLVGQELREKFDRQRYLLNRATWHGDMEAVRREAPRMVNAWRALDRAATAAGASRLDEMVWEIAADDGSVIAIVPDTRYAARVVAEGRGLRVYTLDEVSRLLSGREALLQAVKEYWPGATVEKVTRNVPDPLDSLADSDAPLDDEIPF